MIPRRLRHNDDTTNLRSIHSIKTELSKLLESETGEELLAGRDLIIAGLKAIQSFIDAVKAAAKSLRTSCTQAPKTC